MKALGLWISSSLHIPTPFRSFCGNAVATWGAEWRGGRGTDWDTDAEKEGTELWEGTLDSQILYFLWAFDYHFLLP